MENKPESGNIKESFHQLLKSYRIESKYLGARIKTDWERLMGKPIANRTSGIRLHDKKLKVYLTSAPLKHEMTMSKGRILEILRQEYGDDKIEDIAFI